ncbi:glycosyltransferase family 2 protein [Microbulbifer sp. ALW1]|uniref:glycosyltransferase family 2 protein n=1 Tax=Microbulbifer sp. (strain ALW1) TaxID=1516059 RepID=UPI001359F9FA|nr:glycosyltransferase family 2 protein [Microbulbifer sp. ALW1]
MKQKVEDVRSTKVSILIVCYNSLADIGQCIASVTNDIQKYELDAEMLLVDNSNDGTVDFVSKSYPSVKIIENNTNLGFAAGNNLLAKYAKGDYFLLLNPDTKVFDGAISNLLSISQEYPECGAWGGSTYFPDGKREYSSLQVEPTLKSEFVNLLGLSRFFSGRVSLNKTDKLTPVLSGAFMMISREIWSQLDGFDTGYFLYSEEVDLCFRIRKITDSMLLMSDRASVTHFVGKSSSSSERTLLMYKGKMHYCRKHYGISYSFFYGTLLWLYALSRYVAGWMLRLTPSKGSSRNLVEKFRVVVSAPWGWSGGYREAIADSTDCRSGA